ncbi:MAG: nicotinamide-nucleotide amidohydrolase family protein [Candidatus Methanomethylophilaceae archaeon]|nr:nicotinamide-nucleotide amidohydrolase family protein [Candidatus Methanomethylophilaceae archaeon]
MSSSQGPTSKIIADLRRHGLTVSTAESCTGGLIGKMLTDPPGSSCCYLGGIVAYSDTVKINLLQVDPQVIADHGAVSAQVALQMADGVRRSTGSDIGISCTGIAGPGGGTESKPVGLVCMALSANDDRAVQMLLFKGGRDEVRQSSAIKLLSMLDEYLEKKG